jgi:hypothetical protein
MKKILIILLFLFPVFLSALSVPQWEQDVDTTQKAVNGIKNIFASIISDTFAPMTGYRQGEWQVTGVPAWFEVEKVYQDPAWEGKGLSGWGFGLGFGYAFTDSLMAYGIFSHMQLSGKVQSESLLVDTDYSLENLLAGAGYDFLKDNPVFSFPVYGGLVFQYYNTNLSLPPDTYSTGLGSGSIDSSINGNGLLFGVSLGAAFSVQYRGFRLMPYFFMYRTLNNAELTAEGTASVSGMDYSVTHSYSVSEIGASMFGLVFGFQPTDKLEISLSLGGILSSSAGFYNDYFLDGLRMKTIALVLTYRGNLTE